MGRGAAHDQGQPSVHAEDVHHASLPGQTTSPSLHDGGPAGQWRKDAGAGGKGRLQLSEVERVQRKWQMASVAHFLEAFKHVLPLKDISEDTAEDLTPVVLERAVAEPEVDAQACVRLRDVVMSLLVVIGVVTRKGVHETWFESLRVFVGGRRGEFMDCFAGQECVLGAFENGMQFLASVGWDVRLGMLLSLCDIAAEEGGAIREAIREGEVGTAGGSELDARGYRLMPIGRCSKRRFHYKVGKTRIYSGYKRKGAGGVLAECSDSKSMAALADALASSAEVRDQALAGKIRDMYLAPLLELEEKARKKVERKRLAEVQKEESRKRNSVRPRRAKATYL